MANVPVVQPAAETAPVKDPLTLAMEKVRLERAAKQLEGKTQEVASQEQASADAALNNKDPFTVGNPLLEKASELAKAGLKGAVSSALPGGVIGGKLAAKGFNDIINDVAGPVGSAVAPAQEMLAEQDAIRKRFADAKAFNIAREKELEAMGAPPVPGALEAENRRAEAEYLVDLEEYRKKHGIVDESDLVFSKGGKGTQGQSAQPGKPQPGGQGGQAYGGGAGGGGGGGAGGGGGGGMGGLEAQLSPEEMALRRRQAEVQLAYDDQYQAQRRAMAQIEAQGAAAQDHAAQRQKMLEDYQHVFNQTAAQIADAPDFSRDAFWANKNTGQTIATVVGTLLQGIGLGLAGKPELAANLIDQKIEQDLMIQKLNFQKRKDVSGAALDAYSQAMRLASNADEADKLAKVSMYDRIAKDIESQATKVKGAESAADFDMMLARLAERREEALLKAQVAMMKRKGGRGGGGGGGGAVGPGGGGSGLGAPVGRGGPGGPELGGFVDPEKVVYTHGKFGILFNDKTSHDKFSETNRYINESKAAIKDMIRIAEGIENGTLSRFDASTREAFNRAKMAAMPPTSQAGGAGVINGRDEIFMSARLGGVDFKDVAAQGLNIPGARFLVNKNAVGQLKEALSHTDNILKTQAEANGGAVVVNTGETYAERAPGGKSGAKREVAAPRLVRGVDVSGIDSLANQIDRARQPAGAAQPKPEFTVPTDELGR